jgi:hypothetical protein
VLFLAGFGGHRAVHNTFNVQRHVISRRTLRLFRAEAMNSLAERQFARFQMRP